MPMTALVVEPLLDDALTLAPVLSALGFQVTTTESFKEATHSLRTPPKLLIADIRLGEFNGLHLVLRGRSARPDMAAIVTSTIDDPVHRAEADAMGATFILKSSTVEELQAAIFRTVFQSVLSSAPIRSPFERRKSIRRSLPSDGFTPERRRIERRSDARERLAGSS